MKNIGQDFYRNVKVFFLSNKGIIWKNTDYPNFYESIGKEVVNMDIMSIVEKYIRLSMEYKELEDTMYQLTKDHTDYLIKADFASLDGEHEKVRKYDREALKKIEEKGKITEKMQQLKQQIYSTEKLYQESISLLDEKELEKLVLDFYRKREKISESIKQLSQQKEDAVTKAEIAYLEDEMEEVKKYDKVAYRSLYEIQKQEKVVQCYDFLIARIACEQIKRSKQDSQPKQKIILE